jgi:hypothetical protein
LLQVPSCPPGFRAEVTPAEDDPSFTEDTPFVEDTQPLERRRINAYFEPPEEGYLSQPPSCPRYTCIAILPEARLQCSYEGRTLTTFGNVTLVHQMCHHTLLEDPSDGLSVQCKYMYGDAYFVPCAYVHFKY